MFFVRAWVVSFVSVVVVRFFSGLYLSPTLRPPGFICCFVHWWLVFQCVGHARFIVRDWLDFRLLCFVIICQVSFYSIFEPLNSKGYFVVS